MEPAWPEKVVGFLFVLEVLLFALLQVDNQHFGSRAWMAGLPELMRIPIFTLGPPWVVMRMLDWMFAGPARRRGALIVRPHL